MVISFRGGSSRRASPGIPLRPTASLHPRAGQGVHLLISGTYTTSVDSNHQRQAAPFVEKACMSQNRYVALLSGINVGGHLVIRMADLKELFESLGMHEVSTYIQTGNVLFSTDETDRARPSGRSMTDRGGVVRPSDRARCHVMDAGCRIGA